MEWEEGSWRRTVEKEIKEGDEKETLSGIQAMAEERHLHMEELLCCPTRHLGVMGVRE